MHALLLLTIYWCSAVVRSLLSNDLGYYFTILAFLCFGKVIFWSTLTQEEGDLNLCGMLFLPINLMLRVYSFCGWTFGIPWKFKFSHISFCFLALWLIES